VKLNFRRGIGATDIRSAYEEEFRRTDNGNV
jgi:hypothetical protein